MASDFPASIDAFPDPLVNSPLNSPSHAVLHQDVNDAVEKIEVKLGVGVSPASVASAGQVLMADGSGSTQWASITSDEAGLVKVASGTLSGSATNFVGCFTNNHTNYRIVIDSITTSAAAQIVYRFLNNTAPEMSTSYSSAFNGLAVNNTARNLGVLNLTFGYTGCVIQSNFGVIAGSVSMDVYNPLASQRTFITSSAGGCDSTTFLQRTGFSFQQELKSFDGIQFLLDTTSTFTGNVTIYGYRK
jgi:hypothetical protein